MKTSSVVSLCLGLQLHQADSQCDQSLLCVCVCPQTVTSAVCINFALEAEKLWSNALCAGRRMDLLVLLFVTMNLPARDHAGKREHEVECLQNSWTRLTPASPWWCLAQDSSLLLPWGLVIANEASGQEAGPVNCPTAPILSSQFLSAASTRLADVFSFCLLSTWLDSAW